MSKWFVCICCVCYFSVSYAQDFNLGIAAHLLSNNPASLNPGTANNKIKAAGIKYVRMDALWRDVEINKGQLTIPQKWDEVINEQKELCLEPILILAYGNKNYQNGDKPTDKESIEAYVKYASYVVNHFKGRVKYYQIWNEWNGTAGATSVGSVRDYKILVKATYPAIKKTNPESVIITGEFSNGAFNKELGLTSEDFLRVFLSQDMVNYTDVIGIHPYVVYRTPPYNGYWAYLSQIKYASSLVKQSRGFSNKPLFITEIGWSTASSNKGVSESSQSKFITNAICDAKKIGISAVIIYQIRDGLPNNSHPTEPGFGIYKYNWDDKPIVSSLKSKGCW